MARFKCCAIDRKEINPLSAILNFASACLIATAIFNDWLLLKPTNNTIRQTNSIFNSIHEEVTITNCSSIGSQLFLLPAKFTMFKRNGTSHIFYHYDNLVYMDCISPEISDVFYLITAFCFVAMSIATFGTLLQSMSPPFPFFNYLRLISALEAVVCMTILLILALIKLAKIRVEELQEYTGQKRTVLAGPGVYLLIFAGLLALNAAIVAQLRQRKIRLDRREENKRLMCTRPLRSRRDVPQNDYNPHPIAEMERYLLEPGLRRQSNGTILTTCADDQQQDQSTNNL